MEDNNKLLVKTFFWMFLGLLSTVIVSAYTYSSGLYTKLLIENSYGILLIVEVAVVLIFSLLFRKLPATIVGILFFLYSMINGVSMSIIFGIFELSSVIYVFGATALFFAVLAFYGYTTKRDISRWGTLLYTTLFIGIIVSIVNLFVGNSILDLIVNWFILFVFFGLTIYDMNKIKNLRNEGIIDENKVHIYGAMQLYLDFINIFLRILSIFGKAKD